MRTRKESKYQLSPAGEVLLVIVIFLIFFAAIATTGGDDQQLRNERAEWRAVGK